jgi:hypothetical protein
MKVFANKTNPEFIPIEVKLIIETEEELDALQTMSRLNDSIPKCLDGKIKPAIVAAFLDALRNQISCY